MLTETAIECVAAVEAVLGEGPVWVEREQALYWLDIKGRKIFRMDSAGERQEWATPFRIGCLAPREQGGFIAATDQGIALVDPSAGRFELVCNPEPDRPDNRFNDGKVDRQGRFWTGSMDDGERSASGAFYRFDAPDRWTKVEDGYRVTNGPAFSPDGRLLYENDSARSVTYLFDLGNDGVPENKREFRRYPAVEGFPDGMTVDSEGCLWIAFWDGWCIRRYSADGKCLRTIRLPVQRPTSIAFGGPKLDRMYVTSARVGLDGEALAGQPEAGGLFRIDAGVTGIAERPFAG